MLYGVGLAASTNNCQLNVPRIDPPGCLLRDHGYPSYRGISSGPPSSSSSLPSIRNFAWVVLAISAVPLATDEHRLYGSNILGDCQEGAIIPGYLQSLISIFYWVSTVTPRLYVALPVDCSGGRSGRFTS